MPDWLKNQIAAGEVVERPASVVKELVENALDAGATRIIVEVEEGGRRRIRIIDNGSGMNREEAVLALQRHATSKCSSIEDLRNIATFGFRGEALPSIASVCRFTLRTRPGDTDSGIQIQIPDGRESHIDEIAMASGTEILVEDLFFNVPVRRKFLKTEATEKRNIVEVVQRMALSNHLVHFELTADGKRILTAPPEQDHLARIHALLGKKVCEHLYECFLEGRVAVRGFISAPTMKKRGASSLFTFVNGRFIRDKLIIQAILNGYSTLLGRGEYPYAVLDIILPPAEVDVNVHPAKAEVRFQRSNEIFAALARAVRLTVSEAPWVTGHFHGNASPYPHLIDATESGASSPDGDTTAGGKAPYSSGPQAPFSYSSDPLRGAGLPYSGRSFSPDDAFGRPDNEPTGTVVPTLPSEHGQPASPERTFSSVHFLGQYVNCFLLGQIGETLVIVDQHAAHERVLFEKLRVQFDSSRVTSQALLVPQLLELEPVQHAALEDRKEVLERLGFTVEPFGGSTVAVKAVPMLLKQRSPERMIRALLDDLSEQSADTTVTSLFHKPISTMACHAAVRAGDPMAREEAIALFKEMEGINLAAYCPHGRPVVVFFNPDEVGRWFHRT
jgi:DNA mismatch repair protein MutL